MKSILKNAQVFKDGRFVKKDITVENGMISDISDKAVADDSAAIFDFYNCILIPGLVDVHVHLREPGFSYKETLQTGTLAAAHGGYTTVFAMPNLDPVPDSAEKIKAQVEQIEKKAKVRVFPYAAITVGERGERLSQMEDMAEYAAAFSDDGRGVQNELIMREAMSKAKKAGKIIAAHCEDNSLLKGGYIHDGEYARTHGHKGICSESEWKPIERDLKLAKETGCAYHVCHVSAKESVSLIRKAKSDGVDVTCETAPHYLVLNDANLQEDGRFKMNPPLRSEDDRQALINGIKDGTVDMIATDHAPHSAEEKARGLRGSLMGVVGLETAFPVLFTELVKTGIITLEKLIELMCVNPIKRFGKGCVIEIGNPADITVFDLNESYKIDPEKFLSKGRSTPFANKTVYGKCKFTMVNGRIIWQENVIER